MTSPPHLSQAVEPFLRQMAADGRMESSITSYRRQLHLLIRGLHDIRLDSLTPHDLNGYLTSALVTLRTDGRPKQVSTLNRAKSVVRTFFRWCEQTELVQKNPAAHVRLGVPSSAITRYMTRREVERFLRGIRQARHPLGARDHALFATLAYTGIRLSDVILLRKSDVDLTHRRLLLQRTKGGGREQRHLPSSLRTILSDYIRTLPTAPTFPDKSLFLTRRGRPLTPRAVQYRFAFWVHRARIRKSLSVHSLRHTFGTLLYQTTKDLVLVSRALGHRDVKNTQRYAHLDDRQLARAVNGMW